jgi:predicted SPOUT superfamily RNA methylase MTH1
LTGSGFSDILDQRIKVERVYKIIKTLSTGFDIFRVDDYVVLHKGQERKK